MIRQLALTFYLVILKQNITEIKMQTMNTKLMIPAINKIEVSQVDDTDCPCVLSSVRVTAWVILSEVYTE